MRAVAAMATAATSPVEPSSRPRWPTGLGGAQATGLGGGGRGAHSELEGVVGELGEDQSATNLAAAIRGSDEGDDGGGDAAVLLASSISTRRRSRGRRCSWTAARDGAVAMVAVAHGDVLRWRSGAGEKTSRGEERARERVRRGHGARWSSLGWTAPRGRGAGRQERGVHARARRALLRLLLARRRMTGLASWAGPGRTVLGHHRSWPKVRSR